MSNHFEVHDLLWDRSKIKKFWEFAADFQGWKGDYFSLQAGKGIVSLLKALTPMHGRVLDFGCGPGHLIDHLLAAGVTCEGADLSVSAIESLNRRLEGHEHWRGGHCLEEGKAPFDDESMDLVICVETIEHLMPEALDETVRGLLRILKPGTGRVFITTPHAELLDRSKAFCPECGSVFHRYQHISSFTQLGLIRLMEGLGFKTLACAATDFTRFQEPTIIGPLDWSPRYILKTLLRIFAALGDVLPVPGRPTGGFAYSRRVGSGPHLFYLGQRT